MIADPAVAPRAPGRRATAAVRAIVLRRSDYRESSRIVTCLCREHGRITGLAKGAHRPDSPFLGRIDFLAEVMATFSPDRGGLRLLERAVLVRERRALREPTRFLAASHLAELADLALPAGRPEPTAFDLLLGGLNLLERCPEASVGQVVLGLELRFLELFGGLPDLHRCAGCGDALTGTTFLRDDSPALVCRRCAGPGRRAVSAEVLHLLRGLLASSGRQWPQLDAHAPVRAAASLPAAWLAAATEHRPGLRALLFARC